MLLTVQRIQLTQMYSVYTNVVRFINLSGMYTLGWNVHFNDVSHGLFKLYHQVTTEQREGTYHSPYKLLMGPYKMTDL